MRINPFKNVFLKISAFALALLLWVHVATNKSYEYQLSIPISIVDVPQELVLISDPPEDLSIKIRATGKQLVSMAMGEPRIKISAAGYRRGSYDREIEDTDILAALDRPYEDFELVIPRKLDLTFETRVEKRLLVLADNVAEPALGFAVVSPIQVEPETVTVSGPASVMSRLRHLSTDSTKFVDLDEPVRARIDLLLPDSLRLSASDSSVVVSIEVEAKKQKAFSSVPITAPASFNLDQYAIVPETLSLVLEIPESGVDSFSVADFTVTFRRPPIMQDSARAELRWLLPENVRIVGAVPDSIMILPRQ